MFDTLFTDDLYWKISRHAIQMAIELKDLFRSRGFHLLLDSPTNQQFILLENSQMKKLSENVDFSYWEAADADHTVVRFDTSWSTTQEDLEILAGILDACSCSPAVIYDCNTFTTPHMISYPCQMTKQTN